MHFARRLVLGRHPSQFLSRIDRIVNDHNDANVCLGEESCADFACKSGNVEQVHRSEWHLLLQSQTQLTYTQGQ